MQASSKPLLPHSRTSAKTRPVIARLAEWAGLDLSGTDYEWHRTRSGTVDLDQLAGLAAQLGIWMLQTLDAVGGNECDAIVLDKELATIGGIRVGAESAQHVNTIVSLVERKVYVVEAVEPIEHRSVIDALMDFIEGRLLTPV